MHLSSHRPRAARGAFAALALAAGLAACSVSVKHASSPTSTTGSSAPTTTSATGPSTTAAAAGSSVAWHGCGGGFQCGTHTVPLDWFHPGTGTISLALIRRPAGDPSQRIGSLFFNPGGPGEPGTSFLRDLAGSDTTLPKTLLDRFDLVSWDPRGTGDSAGVQCIPASEQEQPALDPTPNNAAAVRALTKEQTSDVARCVAQDGKVLPFVGTRETSHDLDALRAAVGDAKLHYVGYSYGTEIGAQYLRDFPSHVGAMVLDGVVVPGENPIASSHDQAKSFETDLDAFLADCKARSSCTFGNGDPRAALQAFLAKLESGVRLPADYTSQDDQGVSHTRTGTLGIGEAITGIITPLYSKDDWPALEKALTQATAKTDPNGYLLLSFRDSLQGRDRDGTWNHLPDAFEAIGCADQAQRATSVVGSPALIAAWSKEMPFLGATQATGAPGCYLWPASRYPVSEPTRADFAKAPPMVFVNSTQDPATPYAQAVHMRSLVPGSRLVTWESADHTSFGRGHACIDDPITDYLVNGTLPPAGLHCKP
jgi:pimeloyl-ACP methyl ester carboxylesterase